MMQIRTFTIINTTFVRTCSKKTDDAQISDMKNQDAIIIMAYIT